MNKKEFKHTIFSLSENIFPMVARMLGSTSNAEDAIQEIMIKLWQKRKKLEHHPNVKGFVVLTARNYCIDVLRKKMLVVDDSTAHLRVLKSSTDFDKLAWEELNLIVQKIIETIPKSQREVFLMRDLDGYEFKEIAFALKISVAHTRVLISRARKKIREELETKYHYEKGGY
ncbi:RNA polymerase sigma factor [Polaribacter sp.]|nr:RNA polymerase sigma factor [Polaribacter sp.]